MALVSKSSKYIFLDLFPGSVCALTRGLVWHLPVSLGEILSLGELVGFVVSSLSQWRPSLLPPSYMSFVTGDWVYSVVVCIINSYKQFFLEPASTWAVTLFELYYIYGLTSFGGKVCGLVGYARVIMKVRGQLTGVFFSSHHVGPNSELRTASLAPLFRVSPCPVGWFKTK